MSDASLPDTPLKESRDAGLVTLTLDRPDRHNAFDDALIATLTESLERLAADAAVRAVVLRGEGKSFSAGADLGWMRRMADYTEAENRRDAEALGRLMHVLDALPVPTVAAVQGAAIGGGVGLVACCDIAVASERAVFALSEVRLGLVPAVISPFVVRAMGARAARRYFLTGERFDAATAHRLGLVHQCVAPEALDGAVAEIVEALGQGGPAAQRAAKRLVADVAGRPPADCLEETARLIADIRASEEGREGLGAFLEKRDPAWRRPS